MHEIEGYRGKGGRIHLHRFPGAERPGHEGRFQKVKERVWQAVREAGYTPDEAARELRGKRRDKEEKRYVACVYARVTNHRVDSFFSQLVAAVEYELFKNGYVMKYSIYAGEMDVDTFTKILRGTEVDGIVVMGRFSMSRCAPPWRK